MRIINFSKTAFTVFEDSELATSGSFILVNENYETSDPSVFAMGNFIKHHKEPNHQYRYVSPQEAAEKVNTIIFQK